MELMAAMSALSSALGLAKTAIEARDEAKLDAALADINTKHLALSMAGLQLAEALSACQAAKSELERENRDLHSKIADRKRYLLHELAPGQIAYRSAPDGESAEPEHYLCQVCYDKGVKSVLHVVHDGMLGTAYECLADKTHTFYG
jgi:cell division protein FtsB